MIQRWNFILVCVVASRSFAADPVSTGLPRSTPEAQGVSSATVLEFIEAADVQIDTLHVGAPAEDGYHPLCSLMTFADVGDHLARGKFEDV